MWSSVDKKSKHIQSFETTHATNCQQCYNNKNDKQQINNNTNKNKE